MPNMFTLKELQALFPPIGEVCSYTGYIPMAFVESNLEALAAIVKEHGLRRIYRGPRHGAYAWTNRAYAHSLVLYGRH